MLSHHESKPIRIVRNPGQRRSLRSRQSPTCLRRQQAQQRLARRLARHSQRRWRHWHEEVDQPPRIIG